MNWLRLPGSRLRSTAGGKGLQSRFAAFAGANADDLFDRQDEDFAVAELAGLRRLHDGVNRLVYHLQRQRHFDLHLRQKIDLVLAAAIGFGVALLAPKAADFGDRQAINADFLQGVLDGVEQVRADDRFYLLHTASFIG